MNVLSRAVIAAAPLLALAACASLPPPGASRETADNDCVAYTVQHSSLIVYTGFGALGALAAYSAARDKPEYHDCMSKAGYASAAAPSASPPSATAGTPVAAGH